MPTTRRQLKSKESTAVVSDEVALIIHAALLATWMGLLLWSSLASDLPAVPRILAGDKLQHLLAYAVLMFFSGRFFKSLSRSHLKGWLFGFIFTVGFGFLMEIGQETLSLSRHADWKDLVANTIGAAFILFISLLKKKT